MNKVGVYLRVSTHDQEKGIESQRHALEEYLSNHGIAGAKWYEDRLSGSNTARPQFQQLQRAIFKGQIKTVVCWKLDRLSRSLKDGITILTDWIADGVRVVSVAQQLDFTGTIGQMVAGILFALAQMERENLRENTKRGMAKAKAAGVKLGKRPKLFACDIKALLEQGMSMTQVAAHLGKSRQACYNALRREK